MMKVVTTGIRVGRREASLNGINPPTLSSLYSEQGYAFCASLSPAKVWSVACARFYAARGNTRSVSLRTGLPANASLSSGSLLRIDRASD
jgi:hypothetical protein